MTSLYEALKASKTKRFPDYWTLLWGRKLSAKLIKTLTSTLPLTFNTSETKLRDWTISGNDEGVGVRTKNFVDITGYDTKHYNVRWYEDNGQLKASGTYTDTSAHTWPRFYAKISAGTYTLSGSPDYAQSGVRLQVGTCTDAQGSNFTVLGYDTGLGYSFTLQAGLWISVRVYTAASLYQQGVNLTLPIMVRKADTTPDFIPFGYEIPLTVSQDETDKSYDIFIGDAPLIEGETVSKTSTGIDIELFEGENTVSTTLTNKPEMTIKYK
jgi:hypothetical protein